METILLEAKLSRGREQKNQRPQSRGKPKYEESFGGIGTIQLVEIRPATISSRSMFALKFIHVKVSNERHLPLNVLLLRDKFRGSSANEKELKSLDAVGEVVQLDDGPDGCWKGHDILPDVFVQELTVSDPLAYASIAICKLSVARPPTPLPLIYAFGDFEAYQPPPKSFDQIQQELEELSKSTLHLLINSDPKTLSDEDELNLPKLQRQARHFFRLFDEDKSDSIDFDEFKKMLTYQKLNILDSKALRFFQLVDDHNKGYIDEREFVIALYIAHYLRREARKSERLPGTPAVSPIDVFHQLDGDHDNLLNYFEYQKAMQILSTNYPQPWSERELRKCFPVHSFTIGREAFQQAWAQLVDARRELTLRGIDYKSRLRSMRSSKIPLKLWKEKGMNILERLLLDVVDEEQRVEMELAQRAKDEVVQLEKTRREGAQEENREKLKLQRQKDITMRTAVAVRERKEKIDRKKERQLQARQAREERTLQKAIEEETWMRGQYEKEVAKGFAELQAKRLKGLTKLPGRIYLGEEATMDLSYLLYVNISGNRLRRLPGIFFQHLLNVQWFDASSNCLEELPDEIDKMKSLEVLNLHNNKLATVPKQMYGLPKLKRLAISFNFLTEFGEGCENLQMLEELDLANNRLQRLSSGLGELRHLQYLRIANNPNLDRLPDTFIQLEQIANVDFGSNALR